MSTHSVGESRRIVCRHWQTRRASLPALTSLRFFAAAAVVLAHLESGGVPLLPKDGLADAGYQAVTFFFVLSGFILVYVYSGPRKAGGLTVSCAAFPGRPVRKNRPGLLPRPGPGPAAVPVPGLCSSSRAARIFRRGAGPRACAAASLVPAGRAGVERAGVVPVGGGGFLPAVSLAAAPIGPPCARRVRRARRRCRTRHCGPPAWPRARRRRGLGHARLLASALSSCVVRVRHGAWQDVPVWAGLVAAHPHAAVPWRCARVGARACAAWVALVEPDGCFARAAVRAGDLRRGAPGDPRGSRAFAALAGGAGRGQLFDLHPAHGPHLLAPLDPAKGSPGCSSPAPPTT